MGTWSIEPSGGLASIDNTGKLTYQEHTEDKTYKIKYQDETCGTITKDITIKKCEGPTPPCPNYNIIKMTFTNEDTVAHDFGTWTLHDRNNVNYTIEAIGHVGAETTKTLDAYISPSIPEGTKAFFVLGDKIFVDGVAKEPPAGSIRLVDCNFVCDATWP